MCDASEDCVSGEVGRHDAILSMRVGGFLFKLGELHAIARVTQFVQSIFSVKFSVGLSDIEQQAYIISYILYAQ